jgi:hypothetical protein
MSTTDVPGFDPRNGDRLHEGCWAEHPDRSLLHILQHEGGRVVYDVFDLSHPGLVTRRVYAMPTESFNRAYSWRFTDPISRRWLWHDKTGFPWDRVFENLGGDEADLGEVEISESPDVAGRLAERLLLTVEAMTEEELSRLSGRRIGDVVQRLRVALQGLAP